MQYHWIKRDKQADAVKGRALIIIALGWGSDWRLIERVGREVGWEYDLLCTYDYRDFSDTEELLNKIRDLGYAKTYLFAWSFGVWVAEQIFAGLEFERAVALNGTPFPVDKHYGIEPRRMAVTLNGLQSEGMEMFNRAAYGAYYDELKQILNPRTLEQNIAELEQLNRLSRKSYIPTIKWDRAVVGVEDKIFPPKNMLQYWSGKVNITSLRIPHYPFGDLDIIIDLE